ncbi:nucleotide-sugar transporter-domain-containing protein [Roridomyces roridus]|uniref:Nucleotide-sugar transporter-domain-containing protein n=1 Tax=Roridomyces roridus TaxID=1738132 RepID=A0AAD7BXF7_9AGAR|nr:nucleotide-sugar transporter-domain-containing protein [Roridomyces roridus]
MYHRPPTVRSAPRATPSPRVTPLLPSATVSYPKVVLPTNDPSIHSSDASPTICGMPLKYVSLVTLAVQNAALSIVMHYSRVSTPSHLAYSPADAVLLNELLKGGISFFIALARMPQVVERPWSRMSWATILSELPWPWTAPFWYLWGDILSPDCWKLSIPAVLYVVQNSLQFVAVSNLPVASFQVTYQMKILTTAAFSVALLRRKLTPTKWLALFFLAIGVGIVQIQTSSGSHVVKNVAVGSAHDSAPLHIHVMSPLKGFGAVTAACFTSGLAGVYFEMVLKNSHADLWVRNVQLSLFSLIPALLPVLYSSTTSRGVFQGMFHHFGWWAWATVATQVFGGLVTAVVIKYSDNIMKGFATSLSIILSFLASVALFDFSITPSFIIGATTVLCATWMYNQPPGQEPLAIVTLTGTGSGKSTPYPGTPIDSKDPILGQFPPLKSKRWSASKVLGRSSTTELPAGLGMSSLTVSPWGSTEDLTRYRTEPYGSPYSSRPPSRSISPMPPPPRIPTSPRVSDGGTETPRTSTESGGP